MKKTILFLTLSLIITAAAAQNKAQRFAVKSGYVEYELSGNTTGTKSIWWDDFGAKSRTEENSLNVTRMLSIQSETKTHTITIVDGNKYWTANLLEKTGQTGSVPSWLGEYNYENLSEAERRQMEKEILDAFGGRIVGKENVLGHECEIVEVMGAKSWIHNGVALKTEAKLMGITIKETAVKFDKNIRVPASRFEPPAGFKYENMDEVQSLYYGNGYEEWMDEDDDEEIVPVNYPFNKFRDVANSLNHKGFKSLMIVSSKGQHIASYLSGGETLSIIATSSRNTAGHEDFDGFESFTRNGRKYYYGAVEDETGTALMEEYNRHEMYIIYLAIPSRTKDELLEIAGKLKF